MSPVYQPLRGKIKAKNTDIPILSAEDIGANEDRLGLKGSPTRVVKTFHPKVTRKGEILSTSKDLDGAINGLVNFLGKIEIL